jgi:hypothetical protein
MLFTLVPTLPIPFSLQLSKTSNRLLVFFNQASCMTMKLVAYVQVFTVSRAKMFLPCYIYIYTLCCTFIRFESRYSYFVSRINIISGIFFLPLFLFPNCPVPQRSYLPFDLFSFQPVSYPSSTTQSFPSRNFQIKEVVCLIHKYFTSHHRTRLTAHKGRIKSASPSLLRPHLAQQRVYLTNQPLPRFRKNMTV